MNQPTKEQIQWFWEQCADEWFSFNEDKHRQYRFGAIWTVDEPPIDLKNLEKYAFPLMKKVSIYIKNEYLGKKRNKVRVMYKGSFYDGESEYLEDAAFEAIYKALEVDND